MRNGTSSSLYDCEREMMKAIQLPGFASTVEFIGLNSNKAERIMGGGREIGHSDPIVSSAGRGLESTVESAGFDAQRSAAIVKGGQTSTKTNSDTGQILLALVSNHRSFVELLARQVARNNKNAATYSGVEDLKKKPLQTIDALLIDAELYFATQSRSSRDERLSPEGVMLGMMVDSRSITDWQIEQLVAWQPSGMFCKTDSLVTMLANIDRWLEGNVIVSDGLSGRVKVLDRQCVAVHISEFQLLEERCREVLKLSAMGLANKSIAARLGVSLRTVELQRHAIGRNLGLHNSTEMCRFAIRHGIIEA